MELAFLNIGTQEMFVILIVILLLFGGKKLPELARGLGKGIREFKDASEGIKREIADQINNFEKDLDVTSENKDDQASTYVAEASVEAETAVEENADQDVAEKKFPEFTTPENTYQHDPGAHPVDESEFYKYGYNDHFAADQNQDVSGETVENPHTDEDNSSKQA